mmetsp:Transcript_22141/g.48422  ORF Transcript_22141/g.48422 Transcript_22141/m.48422 type:complete len:205 (+) Transcript_22141:256-870(+)
MGISKPSDAVRGIITFPEFSTRPNKEEAAQRKLWPKMIRSQSHSEVDLGPRTLARDRLECGRGHWSLQGNFQVRHALLLQGDQSGRAGKLMGQTRLSHAKGEEGEVLLLLLAEPKPKFAPVSLPPPSEASALARSPPAAVKGPLCRGLGGTSLLLSLLFLLLLLQHKHCCTLLLLLLLQQCCCLCRQHCRYSSRWSRRSCRRRC